ncbi:hypothetical protein J5N97_020427 [Dioscorea zingiberensis]|uniref:Uncharacterized protein n=1 Tax=Dioscorea zingiberensis TaxID=325984 RepID=A0A9D5HDS5_9LILI|nr:hypothetical protein J5N97_020427 [Dioscorea zingiberensis]
MNPLTLVKRIQKINSTEASLGISDEASWHAKYKDSAYVFAGGIPFDLTEGDLLAVFSQYGEVVDVNLVRDKSTGKSKGFAFLAYEDQRSTILAVDNLNGAKLLGRIIRVDHVSNYKKKEEEEEEDEERERKREARGVCRAFQRGDCNRGASCKFSHNEQRSANTGWGPKDGNSRWDHDKHDGPPKNHKTFADHSKNVSWHSVKEAGGNLSDMHKDGRSSTSARNEDGDNNREKPRGLSLKDHDRQGTYKTSEKQRNGRDLNEDRHRHKTEEHSRRQRHDSDHEDGLDRQGSGKRSRLDKNSPPPRRAEEDRGRQRWRAER